MFFFASTDPSLIVGFDGLIQNANPAAADFLGFSREEMVGARLIDFIADENSPAVHDTLLRLVDEGGSYRFAARLKSKTGALKQLDFTLAAVRDRKLIKAVGREIIALTSAERELERFRGEFESILNSISEGVHWLGPEGIIRFENPAGARMLGYEVSELLGKPAHPFMHHHRADGSHFPVEECSVYATLRDGITRSVGNEVFWRKDGTSFFVQYTCTPTHDAKGQLNGTVVTFIDITERKKFQEAIQKARLAAEASSRAKSEFVGNMSHEFRTPLNGVIGLSEQLLSSALDSKQREWANMIRVSGESLLVVANNILDFSKIEAGGLAIECADFDLRELINQVVDLFKAPAQIKGLKLETSVGPEVPRYLRGDAGRLRQILSNLLGNAVKFTSEGEARLTVAPVEQSASDVVLSFEVRDTGIGIEAAAQAKLFEAFTQADSSHTHKYGGSGLGLAISLRLVELMKGKMSCESAPGLGSRFTFEVPFSKKPASAVTKAYRDLKGVHILVVSGDAAHRETLAGSLDSCSMRSVCVAHGAEAMNLLRKSVVDDPYEIAILDGDTAVAESLDLARTIRREPLLASLKLMLLVPPDSKVDAAAVKAAGIATVLPGSAPQERLLTQLTEIMSAELVQRTQQIAVSGSLPKQYREIRQKKEIKILLAEDNRINQMVFLGVLQKLGYGADLAINGLEAVKAMTKADYDVIFMDCQMPEMDGYEATRQIRAGAVRMAQNFIHRLVGEEGVVGIAPTGGEGRVAAGKNPELAVADNAHEEGLERIDVADADVGLAIEHDVLAGDLAVARAVAGRPEADGGWFRGGLRFGRDRGMHFQNVLLHEEGNIRRRRVQGGPGKSDAGGAKMFEHGRSLHDLSRGDNSFGA